jgi:hypothetical protein
MESLTRLVSESLARHGFDRPIDYRRLRWSRWFRCESLHSLLFVPSQPGVFALAEEITNFGPHPVGTFENSPAFQRREDAIINKEPRPAEPALSARAQRESRMGTPETPAASAAEGRRLLAVTHFFEDDDMAFVLDRMLSRENPMRARLLSGRYFIRYVVIEDAAQRRSIASALNQWIASAGEKATGIAAHFASSLEITEAGAARPSPFPSGF